MLHCKCTRWLWNPYHYWVTFQHDHVIHFNQLLKDAIHYPLTSFFLRWRFTFSFVIYLAHFLIYHQQRKNTIRFTHCVVSCIGILLSARWRFTWSYLYAYLKHNSFIGSHINWISIELVVSQAIFLNLLCNQNRRKKTKISPEKLEVSTAIFRKRTLCAGRNRTSLERWRVEGFNYPFNIRMHKFVRAMN